MFTVMARSSSWGCSGAAHGDRTNPTISAAQGKRGEFLFSSISTTAMWHKSFVFLYRAGMGPNQFRKRANSSKSWSQRGCLINSELCRKRFSYDPRPGGDAHLEHNHAQKRLHGIWTDFHSQCNLFSCPTFG